MEDATVQNVNYDKKLEIVEIPILHIHPDEENPNEQKDAVFDALVENIREIGMVEPIMVVPFRDEAGDIVEGEYRLVSGEHRWQACRLLGYETIPTIVQVDFDSDMAKFQLVKMNMLKGKMNPMKFTKLYNRMTEKYGDELTKTMMGFVDAEAFKQVYVNIEKALPPEIKNKLSEAKDDIKTVDDLSRVLNELFSTYGSTLEKGFMVFTFGGQTHLWVIMEKETKDLLMEDVVKSVSQSGVDFNEFMNTLLLDHSGDVLSKLTGRSYEDDEPVDMEEPPEDYEEPSEEDLDREQKAREDDNWDQIADKFF